MISKTKVLFIKASPIKHDATKEVISFSSMAIDIFHKRYVQQNPDHIIEILDLNFEKEIHEVMNGFNIANFWNKESSLKYIDQLKTVDKIVVVTPTHNWNYSGLLKQYFDLVLVPKKTFYYNKYGMVKGMLKDKKVQLIFTQGSPRFIFKSHINSAKKNFKQMGIKVNSTLHIASLKMPYHNNKSVEEIMDKHKKRIMRKAKRF